MDKTQLNYLVSELQSQDVQARRDTSYQLRLSNDPQAVPWLIQAANDPDDAVRQNGLYGLKQSESEEATNFLNVHKEPLPGSGNKRSRLGINGGLAGFAGAVVAEIIREWLVFMTTSYSSEFAKNTSIFFLVLFVVIYGSVSGFFGFIVGLLIGHNSLNNVEMGMLDERKIGSHVTLLAFIAGLPIPFILHAIMDFFYMHSIGR